MSSTSLALLGSDNKAVDCDYSIFVLLDKDWNPCPPGSDDGAYMIIDYVYGSIDAKDIPSYSLVYSGETYEGIPVNWSIPVDMVDSRPLNLDCSVMLGDAEITQINISPLGATAVGNYNSGRMPANWFRDVPLYKPLLKTAKMGFHPFWLFILVQSLLQDS